ncbi:hypothetical protein GINT2_001057 [Glugoides intestinalis]
MLFSNILIASTLISCSVSAEEELKRLEDIYGTIPTNENEWVSFANNIDSTLEDVPLWNQKVFNTFAPFLLYSEKHKLKDMDLRLVYETKNEKLKKHWIKHADERVGSLRCSFNIVEISNDEIEFCKNFSKLTKVELSCIDYYFDETITLSNSMKVLTEIPTCTEVELLFFNSEMLKCIIDSVASNSDVLQNLNKLKIVFNASSGIRYLNNAVEKFPSLFKYPPNLSEITIENQAAIYYPTGLWLSG